MSRKAYQVATSKVRMAKLLHVTAPDAIIANECQIFLSRYAGSSWKAMRQWAWQEICSTANNMRFELQVVWYRTTHNLTRDQAIDVIIGPEEEILDGLEEELNKNG